MSDNFKKPIIDAYFTIFEYCIIAIFYISLISMTAYVCTNSDFKDVFHIIRFIFIIFIFIYIIDRTIEKLNNKKHNVH